MDKLAMMEFLKAVRGGRGELDAWLECNSEAECRAAILGAIEEERRAIIERMKAHLTEPQVIVATRLNNSPRELAINECIGIVKARSNV